MRLDADPEVAQVARQVRVEGGEGQPSQELVHGWAVQLVDGERDRADTGAHQLLRRIVELEGRLEQGKSLHALIEEEVDRLAVQAQDQGFEEVDKVVGQLLILSEVEVVGDQLGQERIAQQVEQVSLILNVLDENGHRLDDLDVNQAILEVQ